MLLAMQVVFLASGTFDLIQLRDLATDGTLARRLAERLPEWGGSPGVRLLLFLGVFVGLAVKVPMFPVHGWLAPTYASAPPCVTLLLTGAMSKMGVYGFLRILLPVFPEEVKALLGPLVGLSVISILLGAFAALAQRDLRRMLAYSSMNHLGYALLGLLVAMDPAARDLTGAAPAATALSGVVLQLFNHGITAAALFALVELLERRTSGHSRLDQLGGLRSVAPVFAGLMGLSIFASLGLPGLNGFIGEFLIFAGVFPIAPLAAVLALPGLLVSAWFLLNLIQHVFLGPAGPASRRFTDLTGREIAVVGPVVAVMLVLGVLPQLALVFINPTVRQFLTQLPP
jgi:NADH-quinone oxidoreductase subunit M